MEEMKAENGPKESGNKPKKRLVRILVVLGIGIPVLVELLTLFNLINVQLIGGEEERGQQAQAVEEVRTYTEGDTLFSEAQNPLVIQSMRVLVSAREWRFELNISPIDTSGINESIVSVDSLKLKSGKILTAEDALMPVNAGAPATAFNAEWQLPDGDIPGKLYLNSKQKASTDSVMTLKREFVLGNLPIRYERE